MATLTNLQMRMAAKLLTISATQFVWPKGGEINSLNNLRKRGLVQGDCFGGLQHRHLTEEIKAAFFGENNQTFMIENFHDVGWLIFDDRRYVTNVYSHDDAKPSLPPWHFSDNMRSTHAKAIRLADRLAGPRNPRTPHRRLLRRRHQRRRHTELPGMRYQDILGRPAHRDEGEKDPLPRREGRRVDVRPAAAGGG